MVESTIRIQRWRYQVAAARHSSVVMTVDSTAPNAAGVKARERPTGSTSYSVTWRRCAQRFFVAVPTLREQHCATGAALPALRDEAWLAGSY
jgi:hypothetical protein